MRHFSHKILLAALIRISPILDALLTTIHDKACYVLCDWEGYLREDTGVALPCHISWLGCVSENNLYILNTEVAVPSDKVIWLPITGKTCAVGTYLATFSLTNSFINETCTSRQFEGQHSN